MQAWHTGNPTSKKHPSFELLGAMASKPVAMASNLEAMANPLGAREVRRLCCFACLTLKMLPVY